MNDSKSFWTTDDCLAMVIGAVLLAASWCCLRVEGGSSGESGAAGAKVKHAGAAWIGKPGSWASNPADALVDKKQQSIVPGLAVVGLLLGGLLGAAAKLQRVRCRHFAASFVPLFALALLAYLLSGQKLIKDWNLEFPLWAILMGLLISNTVGTPAWLRPALRTELYIKTGLVLLGAEILMSQLLKLGLPGVCVSWVVTPIVLSGTFWFGQRVLRMESPSLNMVISADMSVCGVSAAIATGAACRATKEEVSLAIGISLAFTAVMMVVMPAIIRPLGMDPAVAGAWIGGTIDATGAVAAAGSALGPEAEKVAVTVKMIQNILIGVVSFTVAVYWVTFVEPARAAQRPGIGEIWRRFPKFVLGFAAASLIFSLLHRGISHGPLLVETSNQVTKSVREWLFCLAFVCIGLETNWRELAKYFSPGGKPVILYVCGQAFNLVLTLLMAWLMFGYLFPQA